MHTTDIDAPSALLGGLSPRRFMRQHWQKKPLLIRQAWPGVQPPATRAELLELAARDDVESRLVVHHGSGLADWRLKRGPLSRRQLPPLKQPGWTLLVQGLDTHRVAARAMLERFRFVPDARLDDLMMSWASEGGGVGPHVDSYDVFLLQVAGRRRWRIAPPGDSGFVPGLPLRILQQFEPEQEWLLEAGDMLYLPPMWAHDGVAEGPDCMTCSMGFRVPARDALAADVLQSLADADEPGPLYRDPSQPATANPGRIPEGLQRFALDAVRRRLSREASVHRALGEVLTEPKANTWFPAGAEWRAGEGVALDQRSRMMYDDEHVYINGESVLARGVDGRLARQLADRRELSPQACRRFSPAAWALVAEWVSDGWAHPKG
jgi:50S ribosomal protein L16 3-hydroxylase